jgi:hypothetical protein
MEEPMHRMPVIGLLAASLALALSCSDDSKVNPNPDKGTTDKPVTTPDKPVTTPDKAKTDGPVAKKVEEYMIQPNEVAGWTFGEPCGLACTATGMECGTHACLSTNKCACIEAAYTILDMEAIIDGSNDPYRCPQDCAQTPCDPTKCGTAGCKTGDATHPAAQCAAVCGNGACEDGEDETGCAADCVSSGTSLPKSKTAAVCGNNKCERDDPGENGFAKEDYVKGTLQINLFLWDLKTSASAKQIFDFDKAEAQKAGKTIEALTGVGQDAFVTSTTAKWEFFAYKSHYMVKMFVIPKSDATSKTEGTAFIKALMNKLP